MFSRTSFKKNLVKLTLSTVQY